MNSFNVLDRSLEIHRNYLLEASAGTGKTFSIENIVVRLLLEKKNNCPEPYKIEQILVVTFTRAATRDLKMRVRANLEKSLVSLQRATAEESSFDLPIPDYLQAHINEGADSIRLAKKRLEQALFCFDQAQIFTIHGFCSRMLRDYLLEGDISFDASSEGKEFSETQRIKIIRDFFRTELIAEQYSPEQIKIISEEYQSNTEKLEQALLKVLKNGLDIENLPSFQEEFASFKEGMCRLKSEKAYTSEKIIADFILQAPGYRDLCDTKRALKSDNLDKVTYFAQLFDQQKWSASDFDRLLRDQLFIAAAFHPSKLKVNAKLPLPEELNYPTLLSDLNKELEPVIKRAGSSLCIFARMAHGCQKMLRKYQQEEEKLGFDDYLKGMLEAVKKPLFVEQIRALYQAAIIDEFQDTDPVQWEIFNTLFMSRDSESGHLYLVGDPKQSIYAFRQADIYTYLKAADAIGQNNRASLDTNFRSQPSLVHALNVLFSTENAPGLIALPRINHVLEYQPVKASEGVIERLFSDSYGSVHVCIAESQLSAKTKSLPLEKLEMDHFFPFFTAEVQRLHAQEGFRYGQFAVLVSDRFQSERIAQFFQGLGIPAVLQRSVSLCDSPALPAMRELLQAVLHPKNESLLKTSLGGPIIGWTHEDVRLLDTHAGMEQVLIKFYALRHALLVQGFASFFEQLLQSCWNASFKTVAEVLLASQNGVNFYQDLQQIAALLLEFQNEHHSTPDALLSFLDEFPLLEINEDERLKSRPDPRRDAVNILTLHSSKGLEFDIVFALGLIKRTSAPSTLLPAVKEGHVRLCAIEDRESEIYRQFCYENDSEKIRQLYVAMTRAKYRLYLPVIAILEGKEVELGCASPMELFLARLGQPAIDIEGLYQRINQFDCNALVSFLKRAQMSAKISHNRLNDAPIFLKMEEQELPPLLTKPERVRVPGQRQFLYSYTALAKSGQAKSLETSAEYTPAFLKNLPHNYTAEVKNAHTLPSGSEIGNLFHLILEQIPLNLSENGLHAVRAFVHPFVIGTAFGLWEQVIAEVVFNTLNMTLEAEEPFCLADVSMNHSYREIEFLYPCKEVVALEGFDCSSGFLKGVIDLFFWHRGKYYLVDWKSNWLGESQADYSQERMRAAMHEQGYFLQAALYKEALKRYLKVVDSRAFEEIFGGTFYVFLRCGKAILL